MIALSSVRVMLCEWKEELWETHGVFCRRVRAGYRLIAVQMISGHDWPLCIVVQLCKEDESVWVAVLGLALAIDSQFLIWRRKIIVRTVTRAPIVLAFRANPRASSCSSPGRQLYNF